MAAHQSLVSRLFWFGAGGGLSVMLNAGPFLWLRDHAGLKSWMAYAISLSTVTVVFSIWNYFINFRTQRSWRDCLPRYLAAIAFCALINYFIALAGLKHWGHTKFLSVLIIGTVQVAVSGLKFFLYHHWVYPREIPAPTELPAA